MFNPKLQKKLGNKVVQQRGNASSLEGGIFGSEPAPAPAAPPAPPCIFKLKASADAPRAFAPRVTLESLYPKDDAFGDASEAPEGPMAALNLNAQAQVERQLEVRANRKVGNGALPPAGGNKLAGQGKKCMAPGGRPQPMRPANNIFG
jgi:hypothetical protein